MLYPSDEDLALLSAQGDQEAFTQLIRRHGRALLSLLRRLASNDTDAEDLFQEAVIRAWTDIGTLRRPDRAKAWLLQVARNRVRDFAKSAQRRVTPVDDAALEAHAGRHGRAAGPDPRVAEALAALDSLPAHSQEAARRFYLGGLSVAEIARALHCPEGTVKRRLHTARERMREQVRLAGEETADEPVQDR